MSKNIIALVYDFDGTLSPKTMQNYTVLPNLGVQKTSEFWEEVGEECAKTGAENTLVWMRKIKELAEGEHKLITKAYFKKCAQNIQYFKGVERFFDEINSYVRKASRGKMLVRHYIISAGLKEILDGISIRKKLHNIFGSQYHYDYSGRPDFPKVVITDTIKTQYLFRINKGKEKISESINEHMPEKERPIPFKNIIYIGDGLTDVPAMTLTKKSGGQAIAVYKAGHPRSIETCKNLLRANRVDFIALADYTKGSDLYRYVTVSLDVVIKNYDFLRESENNRKEIK
jgi:2-hydroxy-3-keto-5-methylthiopentenyl-1-phosphate phosphatase